MNGDVPFLINMLDTIVTGVYVLVSPLDIDAGKPAFMSRALIPALLEPLGYDAALACGVITRLIWARNKYVNMLIKSYNTSSCLPSSRRGVLYFVNVM